jgi:hypothetical protein
MNVTARIARKISSLNTSLQLATPTFLNSHSLQIPYLVVAPNMKISVAAVLIIVSSASAFNVSYLNQLGGPTAPAKAAPLVKEIVSSGPASYLDNLKGTPELVTAMQYAPAPVAPVPVAGAAPASGDYLSALVSTNNAPTGGGLTGYLDALPASVASPTAGAGMTTHLDSLAGRSVVAAPVPAAPVPVPVAAAPVPVAAAPVASPVSAAVSGPGLFTHLDTLRTAAAVSGPGLLTHLDTLTINTAPTGTGAALTGYLSALATNAADISGAGLTGYLDAIQTNSAVSGSSGGSPSVTSFLENVYNQITALPNDNSKTVNGNSVTYSVASGPYAMAFVKN